MAKLKPVNAGGTVTSGSASGINDGAAAMILASEAAAKEHCLTPRARVLGMASSGVLPRVMGIGPVSATQKLMARLGLGIGDSGVIEINEAFASQALASMRMLGLADDASHVNANGGAIALGHPLGMSGARLVMTAVYEMLETNAARALATMRVGVGRAWRLRWSEFRRGVCRSCSNHFFPSSPVRSPLICMRRMVRAFCVRRSGH